MVFWRLAPSRPRLVVSCPLVFRSNASSLTSHRQSKLPKFLSPSIPIFATVKADILILSYCKNAEIFQMNLECLRTLLESEAADTFNVLVIESNKNFHEEGYQYPWPKVKILTPEEDFNFNRFLNLGLKQTRGRWVGICNNDLVFEKGWFSAMMQVHQQQPQIRSFCPMDEQSEYTPAERFAEQDFYTGYRIRTEFVGWCYLVERKAIEEIKAFDERFGFYYQDDDFAMSLRKHSIAHAMVPGSRVHHVGAVSSTSSGINPRFEQDRTLYHQKWGSQRGLAWKNRLAGLLKALGMKKAINHLYSHR